MTLHDQNFVEVLLSRRLLGGGQLWAHVIGFDIISVGVMLQDARHARKYIKIHEIFQYSHNMRGNKFNLIINLNVSIQKAKVKHIHQMKLTCIECHLVKGVHLKRVHFSSWFLHIYLNKMMDPSTTRM
ncbi:hypothetical protein ACJX0J_035744 [Zea mays]